MRGTSPTIVLVHGALTDASVWRGVISDLQQRGYHVLAPAMPMRGLAADAAYLHSILTTVDGPILAAGHSYGGSVISHPGALTPNVRGLVFIAAFQPDRGESAAELNERFPGSLLTPATTVARSYPGGSDLYLRPDRFAEVYAADLSPAVSAVMAAAQHPVDVAALGETFTEPASWARLPSWTMVASADRSIPAAAQRFMARRAGSAIVEIDSAHAVPVAHPDRTADLIAAAAQTIATATVTA